MLINQQRDDRYAVRALARRHPTWSNRRIGRELGKTHKFVARWRERDVSTNLARGRSQRKTVRTEAFDKKVKRKMIGARAVEGGVKRRKLSIRETVKKLSSEGVSCTYFSVRESVHDQSMYRRRRKRVRLDEGFAKRRFDFADSHLDWSDTQWNKILNTDSSPFYLKFSYNRQNDGFWVTEGEDPAAADMDKYTLKTEVYIGCCAKGVTKPYFIDSPLRVNAEIYSTEVLPHFRTQVFERKDDTSDPSTTTLFPGPYLFQQDLATSHWAKKSVKYLNDHMQSFMPKDETPPKFFEWPIEQLFNTLKARVYKRGRARDLKQLKKWIVKDLQDPFWTSWCESAFASMHQRMVDVCEVEGWHTSH